MQRPDLTPPSSPPSACPGPAPSAPHEIQYYLTEGLEGVEHQKYRNVQSFKRAIESQAKKLSSGNAGQYLVFSSVTQEQLAAIERFRSTRHKGLRFHYFNNEKILIVKLIAGLVQELASKVFASWLDVKIAEMGLFLEIARVDSTTYQGNGSQKEADCAWKPGSFRPLKSDWPTLVIECGVSESRNRLEADVHWWFENSGGQVKMVFLISFSETKKEIHFEQWELATTPKPPGTPGHHEPTRTTPTMMHEFDFVAGASSGGSMLLNFDRIFLRPPGKLQDKQEADTTFTRPPSQPQDEEEVGITFTRPPGQIPGQQEADITFTQQELEQYATHVWNNAQ